MEILEMIILLAVSNAAAIYWGEELSLSLPRLCKWLDNKPFNCRPCSTFHLSWSLSAYFAWIASSWLLLIAGVAVAFIIFFIIRYIDNKKIIK